MMFAGVFAIVVGIGMIGQWAVTIAQGNIPGPEAGSEAGRGRVEMLFHLAAEALTALALISSGAGLVLAQDWAYPVYLLATGMLLYTVIASSGYFAQLHEWPMVVMFGVLFVLALVSLVLVL
jgi:hypothetical protein